VYYIQKLRACQNELSPQKVSIYAVFLELTSLSSFLNRNSESPIYRTHRRFCYLRVSYSSIFIPIQHFSRLI